MYIFSHVPQQQRRPGPAKAIEKKKHFKSKPKVNWEGDYICKYFKWTVNRQTGKSNSIQSLLYILLYTNVYECCFFCVLCFLDEWTELVFRNIVERFPFWSRSYYFSFPSIAI